MEQAVTAMNQTHTAGAAYFEVLPLESKRIQNQLSIEVLNYVERQLRIVDPAQKRGQSALPSAAPESLAAN
jgi:hypothetical protein